SCQVRLTDPPTPTTRADNDQATRPTATTAIAARNHRHRHNTTANTVVAATSRTPGGPDGTGTLAAGTPAAQCAMCNTHHSSGPVNRISSCAAAGQNKHDAPAALPNTVIGAISGSTARLAT